jgi:hypothetical protein
MRILLFAVAVLAAGALSGLEPAAAKVTYPTPWCSYSSGIGGDCYQNLAQCQQAIEGSPGFCTPTSSYDPKQPLGYGELPQQPNAPLPQ